MAQTVFKEAEALAAEYGVNRLLFLTLTFPDKVKSFTEAQARWNSLNTGVFKVLFVKAICAFERSPGNGYVHLHAVGVPQEEGDYRTGFDFDSFRQNQHSLRQHGRPDEAAKRRFIRSAAPCLRNQWRAWAHVAKRYSFGIVVVEPIKTTTIQAVRYFSAYLTKDGERLPEDKNRRLVRFVGYRKKVGGVSKSTRTLTVNSWAWATTNAGLCRVKMEWGARQLGAFTMEEAREKLGPRWAHKCRMVGDDIPEAQVPARFLEAFRAGRLKVEAQMVEQMTAAGLDATGHGCLPSVRHREQQTGRMYRQTSAIGEPAYVERVDTKGEA